MSHRFRGALVTGFMVAMALGFASGTALAAKGDWSIGGNVGTSITNGGAFNDSLKAAFTGSSVQYKDISGDWEFGGSIRHGISDKASLDLEVNRIRAKSTSKDPGFPDVVATETGIAIPLNLYLSLTTNDSYDFSFFVGAGPMVSSQWKIKQGTTELKSKNKTTFYAQGGFEGMWKASKQFGITARALGRLAKANDVEWTTATTPPTKFNMNMSGAAFGLGVRVIF